MDPEVQISLDHTVRMTEEPPRAQEKARRTFAWPARYLWRSLLVFAILETLLITASFYFIQGLANQNQSSAAEVASVSARRLEGLVNSQQAPIYAMASHVQLNPHWPSFNSSFDAIAQVRESIWAVAQIRKFLSQRYHQLLLICLTCSELEPVV